MGQADELSNSALLDIVKSARIAGRDFMWIEKQYGIPAARAEQIYSAYYKERWAAVDPNEARMLQLDRLESLIDVLMQMALMGNLKSADTLIGVIAEINKLLGLNIEQTKTEITVVTEKQVTVVYQIGAGVSSALLHLVQQSVKDQKQLAEIEEKWDEVFDDAFDSKTEEIINAEIVT